jgi:putative PIN family toxin of toxin-antitoxin system
MKLRLVLDTNVLIAAARSRNGASFAALQALRAGRYIAVASVPLLLEYEAVLKRPEHLAAGGHSERATDAFLDALCLLVEPVDLFYLWRPQCRDPADDMVLETALNGRAEALVTLNTGDFTAAARFRLPVWTPGQLLKILNEENDS